MNIILNISILLCFVFTSTSAQEYPLIKNFTPLDYNAENQNWSISQDSNDFIYVANNKGLLEYNGAKWTLYPSPNNTIFRSVKVIDDKVYTGFYMDFGYWIRNEFGVLTYTSLAQDLNIDLQEDEQFWNILDVDDWILFQSFQRIYVINKKNQQVSYIKSSSKITKFFEVDGIIYFHRKDFGISQIKEGKELLVSDSNIFKQHNIIDVFKEGENLVFLTDKKGFYVMHKGLIKQKKLPSIDLSDYTIYNSLRLSNGDYAIGTISDGIVLLDKDGKVLYTLDQENGINNNTVLSVFEDNDMNVWVGLDNGISLINRSSNIKIYENKAGTLGTVYASKVHNGNLYLGSNQGLFYKKYNSNNRFKIIENTQGQVWNLNVIDNVLFCSHDSGIFVIDNNKVSYKINTQGTWNTRKIDDQRIISGDYVGLSLLVKKNGKWSLSNKIDGFFNSSKYFEFYRKNEIFINHEYKGIFKILVDDNYRRVIKVTKDTSVIKGLHSSIVKYKGDILYGNHKGIFKYDSLTNRFYKDDVLSKMYSDSIYVSGKLLYEKERDLLWSFSSSHISYASQESLSNNLKIQKIPIKKPLRKGATGYENISLLPSGKSLKGSYNGYLIFDTKTPPINRSKPIVINSVLTSIAQGEQTHLSFADGTSLDYESNNIEFLFGVTNYDVNQDIEYQYKLSGISDDWSNWSTKSSVRFENLDFGDYTFQVKSKVGSVVSENIATYNFTIKRPWYYSNVMVVLYVFGFLVLLFIIQMTNRRHYKRKGRKELEKQQREFELQELEKEKELISLKNEQLKLDVESKNRELATSTMSMIKKNEFLNTIKNELNKINDSGVSRVVKIINRNLNNNDDWKLFEEAFNNADKDFIKKIKSIHPELTPNDLKLCAYLRLNLPSKEIAPLLNISPRSVEVKRYRLRKKMNLDHKDNLTDYILGI